jgi:hypothetical protein
MINNRSEYQNFLSFVDAEKWVDDGLPRDESFDASEKELGFWRKFQVTRMIRHARAGEATRVEYEYLRRHEIHYPSWREKSLLG